VVRFSIIIPTTDRHELLQHSLRSFLTMDRDDLEIIVSDNFSTPETHAVVDAHRQDGRLKYYRTDRRLAMPDHWDFAWRKASGRYVIFNCDDDGLSASGLAKIDRAIEALDPQLLCWPIALYYHPDYDSEGGANALAFPAGHSNLDLLLDPLRIVERYARFECHFFPEGTHCCIARELGERIMRDTGRLFWPPAPDFTASLLTLGAGARYCYIDSMLGFGGRSRSSNAASVSGRPGEGRIQQFFSEFGDQDMYPHHPCKAKLYCNYHFAAHSLLLKYYPAFSPARPDLNKFLCLAQEELLSDRPSPLIDERTQRLFDEYVAGLDAGGQKLAEEARQHVLQRKASPRTPSEIARSLTPAGVKTAAERVLTRLGLYKRTAAVRRIEGATNGFRHAFDVFANWDRIVAQYDITSLANVSAAYEGNLIVSAHRQVGAEKSSAGERDLPLARTSHA